MTEKFPAKPQIFTTDLSDFDKRNVSLFMPAGVKNIKRLRELSIENLWLVGANENDLRKILPMVDLKYLNIYQLLAKDLTILTTLESIETIILAWNTKATSLWNIDKNKQLKALEIIDFSRLEEVEQLSAANQIDSLVLGGGVNKPLKIKTLKPIGELIQLKYLCLTNLKVVDDTLQPLATLKNLRELDLSNQFETKEYAWLSSRLPNTYCKLFNAVNPCRVVGADNKLVWDTMVTGRKKSFVLSTKDQSIIEKHIKNFDQLKTKFLSPLK